MNILVLNCGSSSVKFLFYDMSDETKRAKGMVEKIGSGDARMVFTDFDNTKEGGLGKITHEEAIREIIAFLTDPGFSIVEDVDQIDGVGHRVVHGGEAYTSSVLIDDDVCRTIKDLFPLAPLHNPPNLTGIEIARKLLPGAEQVAVFDTAFHQTMTAEAYMYALPYEYYEQYGVRRYGFHGTSHYYVHARVIEAAGADIRNSRVITAHLGNGSSITAVKNGKVVETSMGMTPLEGLVMGTRSGDLDPAVIGFLIERGDLSADPDAPNYIDKILNKKSGLLGLSEVSNDMREILKEIGKGNKKAETAFNVTAHRLKKYIAAYTGVLGGCDFLVFTAGIGENCPAIREAATEGLDAMGLVLDKKKNSSASGETCISTDDSPGRIWVLPTKEELVIARDTVRVISDN